MTLNSMKDILGNFGIKGEITELREMTSGNINLTYFVMVKGSKDKSYIVQKMNVTAFDDPETITENAVLIAALFKEKNAEIETPHFIRCSAGNYCLKASDGSCFRVEEYIDSFSCNTTDNLSLITEAGAGYGEFLRVMTEINNKQLRSVNTGFHNTLMRYTGLEKSFRENCCGRSGLAEDEFRWLMSVKDRACLLTLMAEKRELPLRYTHNDTKLNNLLFDPDNGKVKAIIDLDTVMPGPAANDFGDAVRHIACDGKSLNPVKAEAFATGFLDKTAGILSLNEKKTLFYAPFCITVELAVRYLKDYLCGDRYFKTSYSEENFDKARQRMELAKNLLAAETETKNIINKILRCE